MAESDCSRSSRALQRRPSFCQTDTSKYRDAFDQFDTKKDGYITVVDLKQAAKTIGYKLSEETIRIILERNGLDDGEKLNFEQFLDLIPRNTNEISKEQHRIAELREKFQRYDLDNNGVISLDEAQWALQVELDITQQTSLRLLNQFVKLDYEHFVDFYRKVQEKKMEIYEMFGKYDKDLDGLISVEEAHSILHRELGFNEDRSRAMVKRYDVNKDGRVSYVEFAEFYIAVEDRKARIRQAFHQFDREQAGSVSLEQARQILEGYLGFSETKARQTVQGYDTNSDGRIDYEEFIHFFTMIEQERQRLLTEFHRYDKDGDGMISFDEFREILMKQGYSEREVQTIMAGYDTDTAKYLSFDEFRRFLNFT